MEKVLQNDDDEFSDDTNSALFVEFPEDGTYTIAVRSVGLAGFGRFTLRASDPDSRLAIPNSGLDFGLFDPREFTPERIELLKATPIQVGVSVTDDLTELDRAGFTEFSALAWELKSCQGTVRVNASSRDFDTVLLVLGSRMEEPLFNDDTPEGDSQLEFVCRPGETYRIIVSSFELGEEGEVAVKVSNVDR